MKHSTPHNALTFSLTRKSTGLTPAHIGLIKMLAARAVADYLAEIGVGNEITDIPEELHHESY